MPTDPSSRTMPDLAVLQTSLGPRYALTRELGRGGWATVYLARDRKHDRQVAIKVFHPELALALGTDRFLQEIRLVAQFQHPHILPLHDSGETADSPYYVMPFVDGESLRQRLDRLGRLPVGEAVSIARDVAGALAYAHERGVVHRDIKPENILLTSDHALVADFGIALAIRAATGEASVRDGRRQSSGGRLSRPGLAVGTPAYMSPEQALGDPEPDQRSDIYSLGVVLYEMLAGAAPYPEVSLQSLVVRHMSEERLPPLAELRDDVPHAVSDAVARALSVEPGERFATAREFAEALRLPAAAGETTATGRRRRRRAAGAAAVIAIAAAVAVWRLAGSGPATEPVSQTAIAVFPFTISGNPDIAYLGNGMVDLLSTNLDGAGDLRAVNAHAVRGSVAFAAAPLTVAQGATLAGRLGAGLYVLGGVVESGTRLRINAALYDRAQPARPVATASVEGVSSELFDLVDALSTKLLAARRGGPGGRLTQVAAVTTRSLPALKAYLEGEEHLRAGRFDSAMQSFGQASAQDSLFALAYYRRAVAADWAANFEVARGAAEAAIRYSSRLTEGDRSLLEAFLAWHRGSAAEAERLYRDALREHPDNVEAWYNLGEVLVHYGGLRGASMTQARPAFERAVYLDPQMNDARLHLIDIAAKQRDYVRLDTLLARLTAEGPVRLRRRAMLAFATGSPGARDSILAELRGANDATVIIAAWGTGIFLEQLADAERIASLLLEPSRPPETQAFGRIILAQFTLGRGRWRDAQRHLDAAGRLDPGLALEYRALLSLGPATPVSDDSLRSVRAALAAWDAGAVLPVAGSTSAIRVHNGVHPLIRLYLLGALSARLGDAREAARAEEALRTIGERALSAQATREDSVTRTFAADLGHAIRAQVEWHAGRAQDALRVVERMRTEAPLERVANSPFFPHLPERFLRAEALHRLGRDREAVGYYTSLQEGRFDAIYLVPTHLRLAEIAERDGDRATAARHYRRVADLWAGADEELRAAAARAAEQAAALGRE